MFILRRKSNQSFTELAKTRKIATEDTLMSYQFDVFFQYSFSFLYSTLLQLFFVWIVAALAFITSCFIVNRLVINCSAFLAAEWWSDKIKSPVQVAKVASLILIVVPRYVVIVFEVVILVVLALITSFYQDGSSWMDM